jgi:hypothetical protein
MTATSLAVFQLSADAARRTVVWEPSGIEWRDNPPSATVPQEKIATLIVGDFLVVLDETNLRGTARHFGALIGSKGDAGDALDWICLGGNDSRGRWVVWLTSAEINGEAIGGFDWRRLSPDESLDHRCRMLPRGDGLRLPIELNLGSTENAARKTLGNPTDAWDGALFYSHEREETIDHVTYTISNDLALRFRNNILSEVLVSKSSSN